MKIQVVGPGCQKCFMTESNVRGACAELKIDADITHIFDMKEIAKLGVIFTPAVVVNGKVITSGKIPTVEELKKIFSRIKEG